MIHPVIKTVLEQLEFLEFYRIDRTRYNMQKISQDKVQHCCYQSGCIFAHAHPELHALTLLIIIYSVSHIWFLQPLAVEELEHP